MAVVPTLNQLLFGNPARTGYGPRKDDWRSYLMALEGRVIGSAKGLVRAVTWAELAANPGTREGQPGQSTGPDAGTHTDPVVGGTVPNTGEFVWSESPEGWRRTGDLLDNDAILTQLREEFIETLFDFPVSVADAVRDVAPLFTLQDDAGSVAWQINRDGSVTIGQLGLYVGSRSLRETGLPYLFSVNDLNGQAAIWLDQFGRVGFVPAPETLALLGGGGGSAGYSPPSTLLGYDGFNVRQISGARIASICDPDGRTFDVRQRVGSAVNAAVVEHSDPLALALYAGQSNVGYGTDGRYFAGPMFPHHCLSFSHDSNRRITAAPPSSFIDFGPLKDDQYLSQLPATTAAFAYERLCRDEGISTPGSVSWTAWEGGQPLASFVESTINWNNLMLGTEKAVQIAALYDREVYCHDLVWVQGESGPVGRSTYLAALQAYIADVRAAIVERIPNQTVLPKFLILQTNIREAETTPTGVELAQVDAHVAAPDTVWMVGPMYHMPLVDSIHQGRDGRMMQGELIGLVQKINREGGTFSPVRPTNVTRTGAVIDITFNVPPRLSETVASDAQTPADVAELEFDNEWISASTPNFGFEYSDSTSSVTILSVAITSANTVRVTLSGTPSGADKKIGYAMNGLAVTDGWANARGLLYADSGIVSPYYALGYAVPPTIRHYCVRFEEDVS